MTDKKKQRLKELEEECASMFEDRNTFEERREVIDAVIYAFNSGNLRRELEPENYAEVCEWKDGIFELGRLYDEMAYNPEEDEKAVSYLFSDGMSTEEKLKALADAWWYATNSGYSDAMANRLMAGQEDAETDRWEQHCSNRSAIGRYYDYLKESVEND